MPDETPSAASGNNNALARRCPICGRPAVQEFKPFCSRRCSDVDLNRWFSGVYAVPAKEAEDETASAPDEFSARD